ncbi:YdcF family protein [Sinomicrobium weinanense]|uniref:YdcF family protein n=1 Tax=Sinomicrobium weinanense TaxID=2842200 RepID=A0A926JR21_9FLAO|nr:YdcF family protein [Sinomicrobium weinanense]MBC9795717.1 YdcF family protein [Sinomicrobium weinanense]MBU3125280.1 YdcF family protein [Sinomicrobium weinanense]
MKNLILLLGAPNDEKGNLSPIAIDRSKCAYNLYVNNNNMSFLCTGGFGEHFNKTNKPHAHYAKEFLIRMGVKENEFLPFVLSENTYEDFTKSKKMIEEIAPDVLFIVSSDFHMERVRLIHDKILGYPNVIFLAAGSTLSSEELLPLREHEKNAVRRLKQAGLEL